MALQYVIRVQDGSIGTVSPLSRWERANEMSMRYLGVNQVGDQHHYAGGRLWDDHVGSPKPVTRRRCRGRCGGK